MRGSDRRLGRIADQIRQVVLGEPRWLDHVRGVQIQAEPEILNTLEDRIERLVAELAVLGAVRRTNACRRIDALNSGDRRDTALHAHFEGIEVEVEGNVHTDRLEHGWLWRIPLPGRVSMGLVIDSEFIRKFGNTPEEQFDNYLRHDAVIRDYAKPARRVTPVVKYTNYQSRTLRGVGPNWALVGDTFGFVDPVFSSGMLIAFESADRLAKALIKGGDRALAGASSGPRGT